MTMTLNRPYFESSQNSGMRWKHFTGCYAISDVQPFADVWNRYVTRRNEVKKNKKIKVSLQDTMFEGAHIGSGALKGFGMVISHPDFATLTIIRQSGGPYNLGWNNCQIFPVPAKNISFVECHYREGRRNAVFDWLTLERERFGTGNNHLDVVIAHHAKLAATAA